MVDTQSNNVMESQCTYKLKITCVCVCVGGTLDDELIYLDPHTTQSYVDVTQPGETDETFHCPYSCRMPVTHLDPSVAVVRLAGRTTLACYLPQWSGAN